MELTEDKIIEQNCKYCTHCNQNILLSYEYEFT